MLADIRHIRGCLYKILYFNIYNLVLLSSLFCSTLDIQNATMWDPIHYRRIVCVIYKFKINLDDRYPRFGSTKNRSID